MCLYHPQAEPDTQAGDVSYADGVCGADVLHALEVSRCSNALGLVFGVTDRKSDRVGIVKTNLHPK